MHANGISSCGHAVVVDPGESEQVIKYLNDNNLVLSDILITHHHYDHMGGVEKLKHTVNNSYARCDSIRFNSKK